MKRIIISGLIASILCVGTVFADEAVGEFDPGITPDNPLYSVDKLIENIQISLTSDTDKEAELLLEIAQERLAEAQKMTDKEKIKYVDELIDKYIDCINEAEEKVSEVILSEDAGEKVKEELSEKLETAAEMNEDIEAILTDEVKEKLEEKKNEVYIVANVVSDLDIDKVKVLREEGLGYGKIAQAFVLAEQSGKTVEEIAALFIVDDKGFGDIAKELNIDPAVMKFRVIEREQAKLQKAFEEAKDDEESVEKIKKKLQKVEEMKIRHAEKLKGKIEDMGLEDNEEVTLKINGEDKKLDDEKEILDYGINKEDEEKILGESEVKNHIDKEKNLVKDGKISNFEGSRGGVSRRIELKGN